MKLKLRKIIIFLGGGGKFFGIFLFNFFVFRRNWNWEKIIFLNNFLGGGIFFLGGGGGGVPPPLFFLKKFFEGVPYPIFFGPNLLVRVKLGYTPNFIALGHVEVPWKFLVGWVGWVGLDGGKYTKWIFILSCVKSAFSQEH